MANEKPVQFVTDAWLESGTFDASGYCAVGHWDPDPVKGALRFEDIDINQGQTLDFAQLIYKYGSVGSSSGSWKFKCWGIDEDNTAPFGYPFGRTKTTEVITVNEGAPTSGGTKVLDVRAIINEIVARGGWSNGNAIGFILENDGSDNDVHAFANLSTSYLVYRISAEPDFTPTPKSVAAPTFPTADDYGLKISFPGVDVEDATEDQLLFTTRKSYRKISDEDQVTCTGGVEKLIAHGLGYTPEATVFLRKNGLSFQLPRVTLDDPVAGGVQGYYFVDDTYLTIFTSVDADTYYYIYLDEQT